MNEEDTGRIGLSWEIFSGEAFGLQGYCEGCTALLNIGEAIALLKINNKHLKFHHSCLSQLASILAIFLEATENAENEVIERQN